MRAASWPRGTPETGNRAVAVNGSFAQLAGDNNSITAVNNSWCQRYWEQQPRYLHLRAVQLADMKKGFLFIEKLT
jgi:hypothetical protein